MAWDCWWRPLLLMQSLVVVALLSLVNLFHWSKLRLSCNDTPAPCWTHSYIKSATNHWFNSVTELPAIRTSILFLLESFVMCSRSTSNMPAHPPPIRSLFHPHQLREVPSCVHDTCWEKAMRKTRQRIHAAQAQYRIGFNDVVHLESLKMAYNYMTSSGSRWDYQRS